MQDEDRSLVHVEAAEPALDLVAIGQVERGVGLRCLEDVELELDDPAPADLARLAMGGVDRQTEAKAVIKRAP